MASKPNAMSRRVVGLKRVRSAVRSGGTSVVRTKQNDFVQCSLVHACLCASSASDGWRSESRKRALISFATVLLKHHGNAGAVHEDDLPVACPFLAEGRFKPILLRGTGGVGDAA